jgi:hypothetical protein
MVKGQAMSFKEAKEKGLSPKVDSIYTSAVHVDSAKAVFKTEADMQKHQAAYQAFLKDFGKFLKKHDFVWTDTIRGFNRIYMAPDGTVEHFLYSFKKGSVSEEKQKDFERLLNLYIKDHKFGMVAPVRFAQCSAVTYMASEE